MNRLTVLCLGALMGSVLPVQAQQAPAAQPEAASTVTNNATGSPSLVVHFASGSAELRGQDKAILDRASRAYNEGKPIVMIVTGTSDRVGNPQVNLALSQRRANAVLAGLLSRGIPADRFQVLAKGQTELPDPAAKGAESENRRVEITWH